MKNGCEKNEEFTLFALICTNLNSTKINIATEWERERESIIETDFTIMKVEIIQ